MGGSWRTTPRRIRKLLLAATIGLGASALLTGISSAAPPSQSGRPCPIDRIDTLSGKVIERLSEVDPPESVISGMRLLVTCGGVSESEGLTGYVVVQADNVKIRVTDSSGKQVAATNDTTLRLPQTLTNATVLVDLIVPYSFGTKVTTGGLTRQFVNSERKTLVQIQWWVGGLGSGSLRSTSFEFIPLLENQEVVKGRKAIAKAQEDMDKAWAKSAQPKGLMPLKALGESTIAQAQAALQEGRVDDAALFTAGAESVANAMSDISNNITSSEGLARVTSIFAGVMFVALLVIAVAYWRSRQRTAPKANEGNKGPTLP